MVLIKVCEFACVRVFVCICVCVCVCMLVCNSRSVRLCMASCIRHQPLVVAKAEEAVAKQLEQHAQ